MSGVVGGYAEAVAKALGGDADPRIVALRQAAVSLDAALDTTPASPAAIDAAVAAWRSATDKLADRLASYLLAQIPLPAVAAMAPTWDGPEGVRLANAPGPRHDLEATDRWGRWLRRLGGADGSVGD